MKRLLYFLVELMAEVHDRILSLNDTWQLSLSDKALHFWVIGLLGMAALLVVYPLFRWLARKDRVLTIAGIYVFTLVLVLTFAIEIGQRLAGTGVMEFADIVFGVGGFLVLFVLFALLRSICRMICRRIRLLRGEEAEEDSPAARSGR